MFFSVFEMFIITLCLSFMPAQTMQNPLYFEDEVVRFNKFERQKDLSITKDNRSGTQKTIDHILIIYLFPTHSTALFSRSFIRKVCLYHCRHTGDIHVHVICTFVRLIYKKYKLNRCCSHFSVHIDHICAKA